MALQEIDGRGNLEEGVISAFSSAYPGIPPDEITHMARNFTQVIRGIIDIGERTGGDREMSHMDVANGLVCSCVANTSLEELHEGRWDPLLEDPSISRISDEEMKNLLEECVARVADWLLGLEVLRSDPEACRKFITGALALGASGWERDRGKLNQ